MICVSSAVDATPAGGDCVIADPIMVKSTPKKSMLSLKRCLLFLLIFRKKGLYFSQPLYFSSHPCQAGSMRTYVCSIFFCSHSSTNFCFLAPSAICLTI